jgi:hypothetical protein
MKKIYLILMLFILSLGTYAQDNKPELNCYNKWAFKFEERGADEVEDGTYTDVIITFRNGAFADCYNGKVVVKNKKVTSFFVELEDGTYEQVIRVWKSDMTDVPIVNGISKTMVTKDNGLVNVLWIKKIRPKKATAKKAPEPDMD